MVVGEFIVGLQVVGLNINGLRFGMAAEIDLLGGAEVGCRRLRNRKATESACELLLEGFSGWPGVKPRPRRDRAVRAVGQFDCPSASPRAKATIQQGFAIGTDLFG